MMARLVTSLLLTLSVVHFVRVRGFKRTNIKFNKNTGGYKDIVVVISEQLSAANCPQILDNVKVCEDHFSNNIYFFIAKIFLMSSFGPVKTQNVTLYA